MNPEILLSIIQLVIGGIVAFLAILLMSKTREASWMCLVCGFLFSYAVTIYQILIKLGVLAVFSVSLLGIPVADLICVALPSIFYILAFILMIIKNK